MKNKIPFPSRSLRVNFCVTVTVASRLCPSQDGDGESTGLRSENIRRQWSALTSLSRLGHRNRHDGNGVGVALMVW